MDDERSSSVLGVWAETLADTSKSAKAYRQILFAIFFQVILYKFMEFEDATTISKVHKHVRHFLQDPSAACIDGDKAHAALYGGFPKEECVLWSDIHSWRAVSTCGPRASLPEALPRSARAKRARSPSRAARSAHARPARVIPRGAPPFRARQARALPVARRALGSRAPQIDPLAPGGSTRASSAPSGVTSATAAWA